MSHDGVFPAKDFGKLILEIQLRCTLCYESQGTGSLTHPKKYLNNLVYSLFFNSSHFTRAIFLKIRAKLPLNINISLLSILKKDGSSIKTGFNP